MFKRTLVVYLAMIGVLFQFTVEALAQPKQVTHSKPNKGSEIYVIMKTRLYEVDEAFYTKLTKAKWLSMADLEELEARPSAENPLFALLAKQSPFLVNKGVNIDPGKEGVLLASTRRINCLPSPDQFRQGKKGPQIIEEGITLGAQVHISADRRFVRAKFIEKSLEIEGIEKVKVVVDEKGTEVVGEIVSVKEARISQGRNLPDGGSILLPLHYRPAAVRKNGRWLVAEITPRIYIEEEERLLRGQPPK